MGRDGTGLGSYRKGEAKRLINKEVTNKAENDPKRGVSL